MLFGEIDATGWVLIIGAIFIGLGNVLGQLAVVISQWKITHKVEEIRHATNSMKDDLIAVTAKAEHAKGVLEGKSRSKEEKG